MNILIINDNGYEVGGVETYLRHLKKALQQQGHNVLVLTSQPPHHIKNTFNDISFHGVNPKSPLRIIPYIFNLNAYLSVKKTIEDFKPDIVHIHFFFYHTSPSILLALHEVPTVMTLHAHELLAPVGTNYTEACNHPFYEYCIKCNGLAKYYPEKIKRLLLNHFKKNIDIYISPSKYYQRLYADHGFGPIEYVPNGIIDENIEPQKKALTYRLLYIGRLAPEKGVEYLIQSMPSVLKQFPQTKLTIVGTGEDEQRLKKLVSDRELSQSIQFVGKIGNTEIEHYYNSHDIVIVPSTYPDNLPTVCIEAMGYGKPIIGTNMGGIPDMVVDGENGYLVEPKNSRHIAEKIVYLFKNPEIIIQLNKNAFKKSQDYTFERHIPQLISIYKNVIDQS